ncbi:MAG TPA: rod shape-determining protein RodA [Bacteriovoracaceae bacterium]|nr:rod shape-determining protein RodA [Bacteriovoracaceae bacterium]
MNQTVLQFLKRYDFSFLGSMTAIFLVGVLNLYSATHDQTHEGLNLLWRSQIIWFLVAMSVAIAISFLNPKTFERFSYVAYVGTLFLIFLVLLMGKVGMGAQRWLVLGPIRMQPSEFMKMGLVLAMARYFTKVSPERQLGFRELIIPGIITMIPAVMVIIQPDLGTGMLLLFIFCMMIFYKRLKWKTIVSLGAIAMVSGVLMYNFGLKEYQRKRIHTFIDPYEDAKGSGYNAIQSEIAIGSGRLFGKGFKNSSQASLNYLPENHTDFVFAIFNEEHGFFGSVFLVILYLVFFMRLIWLASSVQRFYDSVLVIGVMSIFFWHTFINMAMVSGLLPIVGIPLPLMSYGGSSMLTFGVGVGIATSISNSRNFFN